MWGEQERRGEVRKTERDEERAERGGRGGRRGGRGQVYHLRMM